MVSSRNYMRGIEWWFPLNIYHGSDRSPEGCSSGEPVKGVGP